MYLCVHYQYWILNSRSDKLGSWTASHIQIIPAFCGKETLCSHFIRICAKQCERITYVYYAVSICIQQVESNLVDLAFLPHIVCYIVQHILKNAFHCGMSPRVQIVEVFLNNFYRLACHRNTVIEQRKFCTIKGTIMVISRISMPNITNAVNFTGMNLVSICLIYHAVLVNVCPCGLFCGQVEGILIETPGYQGRIMSGNYAVSVNISQHSGICGIYREYRQSRKSHDCGKNACNCSFCFHKNCLLVKLETDAILCTSVPELEHISEIFLMFHF